METKRPGRRRFLKKSAALAGLAVGVGSVPGDTLNAAAPETPDINALDHVLYGQRSHYVTTLRKLEGASDPHGSHGPMPVPNRPSAKTPLSETLGIITPSSLHFTTQHNFGIPDINPSEHQFMLHGMVDRPLVFSMDELKRLPSVSRIHFIECLANRPSRRGRTVEDMYGRTACSEWTGVPLSLLLQEAGVRSGASWIVAEGAESGKHTKSLPLAKAMEDVLIAYGQNGEPLRPDQGFPLRLLVPGFEGLYHVKWLRRIKVVDRPYMAFQENSRFINPDPKTSGFTFDLGPKSVITFPSGAQRLPGHGRYMISGLAWSGGGAVNRVEVSTDGGRNWTDAHLQDPVLRMAHTRFRLEWNWNGDEAVLQSRCTDELGQVQPAEAAFAKFWNMTLDELNSASVTRIGHVNYIQPWRVNRDGSVQNAL